MRKLLSFSINTPATIANLGAGYDSLALATECYNTFDLTVFSPETIDPSDKRIAARNKFKIKSIKGFGEDRKDYHDPAENIFVKAIEHIYGELSGQSFRGRSFPFTVHIRQTNNIPDVRGLGSSAAVHISGMLAAMIMHQLLTPVANKSYRKGQPFSPSEFLARLPKSEPSIDNAAACLLGGMTVTVSSNATPLASDVDCFKTNQFTTGPNLQIARVPISDPALRAVVLIPERCRVITAAAREALDSRDGALSRQSAVYNLSRAAAIPVLFEQQKYDELQNVMGDTLHQCIRFDAMNKGKFTDCETFRPEQVINTALEAGAHFACISGAGPSIAAFATADHHNIGEAMKEDAGPAETYYEILTANNNGAYVQINGDAAGEFLPSDMKDKKLYWDDIADLMRVVPKSNKEDLIEFVSINPGYNEDQGRGWLRRLYGDLFVNRLFDNIATESVKVVVREKMKDLLT